MSAVITRNDAAASSRAVAEVLPPSLAPAFDAAFIRSCHLYDEFIDRLAIRVVRATGIEPAAREPGAAADIVARAGLESGRSLVPVDWLLRRLAARGLVVAGPDGARPSFAIPQPLPDLDPASMREEQAREDASWLPSYVLAETAADDYPAFLRGERTGEELLFSPVRLRLWSQFFSNDNGLYAVNNLVGAVAVEEWMPRRPTSVLELGGGLGSAASALVERLRAAGRWRDLAEYRFTEVVPAFLRRGQQALHARFPDAPFLRFGPLDMNRPFAAQDVVASSRALVYAVNTVHVAHDLEFTLREILGALAPGGALVISECVRRSRAQTVHVEFIFNLMETFRAPVLHPAYRPTGGFLTPEQWRDALLAAGFVDVSVLPDLAPVADRFPAFCVGAITATRPPRGG